MSVYRACSAARDWRGRCYRRSFRLNSTSTERGNTDRLKSAQSIGRLSACQVAVLKGEDFFIVDSFLTAEMKKPKACEGFGLANVVGFNRQNNICANKRSISPCRKNKKGQACGLTP